MFLESGNPSHCCLVKSEYSHNATALPPWPSTMMPGEACKFSVVLPESAWRSCVFNKLHRGWSPGWSHRRDLIAVLNLLLETTVLSHSLSAVKLKFLIILSFPCINQNSSGHSILGNLLNHSQQTHLCLVNAKTKRSGLLRFCVTTFVLSPRNLKKALERVEAR